MKSYNINFDTRFTQKDLDLYISSHFNNSLKEEITDIKFNLEELEWISSEEITFLFAWIKKLLLVSKNITVILPFSQKKYKHDDEEVVERRRFIKFYLWSIWGMGKRNVFNSPNLHFENSNDINELINLYNNSTIGKKVLPFQIINIYNDNDNKIKIDSKYKELIGNENNNIFNIEDKIKTLLDDNNCYSPFENKVISDIISKELIMNAFEHSNTDECYFTTTLLNKWQNINTPYFNNQFLNEKDKETLSFYRDKDKCLSAVKNEVKKTEESKIPNFKIADLNKSNEYNSFKNLSYLEFTFIDFGDGICKTLKEQFDDLTKEIDEEIKKEIRRENLSEYFYSSQNIDSKILEYAFLTESSKDPFERKMEYYHLIPRGLYFLIDMVRRYKGLLVARSGKGKIIFDFSDNIIISKDDKGKSITPYKERKYTASQAINYAQSKGDIFFNGTMISIILPERKNKDFKRSGVRYDNLQLNNYIFNRDKDVIDNYPKIIFSPKEFYYLGLAFLFNVIETTIDYDLYNSKVGILNLVFKKINDKLNELKGKNCVLFIDFECLPNSDEVLRILMYLSNTPLVNEFTKVIILNIEENEFKKIKELEIDILKENASFVFKPIPCIKINNLKTDKYLIEQIKWIGVRQKEDELILTNLFFGKNDSYHIDKLEDKWLAEGNTFAKFQDNVYSIFTNFEDLIKEANKAKTFEIKKWLNAEIEKINKRYQNTLFLTSKGSYQKKYLTLYEPLSFKYTAQYFAKILIDLYIENEIYKYEKVNNLNFQQLEEPIKLEIKESFIFDKILAVTVSSQLIAVEIRNLIRSEEKYKFLLLNKTDIIDSPDLERNCPQLIKLASYLSFEDEKPFSEIHQSQKILIVNDVISTGSLVKRLKDGIEDKQAEIKVVLTVADTRKKDITKDEHECVFFNDFEDKIVSIISSEKESDFIIAKYKTKPDGNFSDIKRINPILNTIITLREEHTEKLKVIYDDPKKLIGENDHIFSNEIFKVGHYKQNLSCNSYFTDMHKLFKGENGKTLLTIIKAKLEDNPSYFNITKIGAIKNNLHNSVNNINSLIHNISDNDLITQLKDLAKSIKLTLNETINRDSIIIDNQKISYKPDLIFHPVFSGIEEVTEDVFHEVFKTDKANIISMQRYETRNGWRFPFPAKRLNKDAKGRHVLIIDSGTLSGQSLVQLIDSISFLEVSRIDVISVIGRLEDYHREFYSRLRSIKVKNTKNNENDLNRDTIVNLNILFGINLHIPSYHSEQVCPYCNEIITLNEYLKKDADKGNLPIEAKEYIKQRQQEIRQRNSIDLMNASYLPKIRITDEIDLIDIFLMRDRIGKVDSYRFYEEYFTYFDGEIFNKFTSFQDKDNKKVLKEIELILICVLHEPNLLGVLKDLLNNIYHLCYDLIENILLAEMTLDELYYKWDRYSLLRIIFIFKGKKIYEQSTFNYIIDIIENDRTSNNYFSFLLYEPFLKQENDLVANNVLALFSHYSQNNFNDLKSTLIPKIINHIFSKLNPPKQNTNLFQAFYNLKLFFYNTYQDSHNHFLKHKISYLSILIQNNDFLELDEILNLSKEIVKSLKDNISENINVLRQNKLVSTLFLKHLTNDSNESIYSSIQNVDVLLEKICDGKNDIANKDEIFKMLDNFRRSLRLMQITFLDKGKDFYNFCNNSSFYLRKLIYNIYNSENVQKEVAQRINFNLDISNIPENLLLNGNELLMNIVYEEIIINAIKRPQNNNVTLRFEIVDSSNKGIKLKISQNKKWIKIKENKEDGGFNSIVKEIFNEKTGFGTISEEIYENKELYNIIIAINLLNIKYGK